MFYVRANDHKIYPAVFSRVTQNVKMTGAKLGSKKNFHFSEFHGRLKLKKKADVGTLNRR